MYLFLICVWLISLTLTPSNILLSMVPILIIVDLNGKVACLDSLETPGQKETSNVEAKPNNDTTVCEDTRKRKLSETAEENHTMTDANNNITADGGNTKEAAKDDPKTVDWDNCRLALTKLIGETPSQELVSFLQQHEETPKKEEEEEVKEEDGGGDTVQKFYTLPVISDKQVRRSIHVLIKSPQFSMLARADNFEGKIRIWHLKFSSDMPADTFRGGNKDNNSYNKKGGGGGNRNGGSKNRTPWPKDRPDFLRFVLYKENVDTTTAAKDVVRMGHLNPKRGINYAGMKDKRGVTSQFCSVYRVEKEQLLAVNKEAIYGNNSGSITSSKGGSNIIKLGNFEYSKEEVRLGTLSGNRFDIVLRNVDIGEDAASATGSLLEKKQLVQQKLEAAGKALKAHGFINYFGMQRFGKFHDTAEVGIAVLKGNFEGAVDIIMREKPDEYPRIAEARKQWAGRFDSIDVKDENAAKEAEMKCARTIIRDLGRFMNCEKSIVNNLSRKPRDYKRAFGSIAKHMRSMFVHSYQSYLFNMVATHRIEVGGSTEVRVGDLVLIEDKPSGEGGGGTSGLKGKKVMVVDEQDISNYSITDVVLPLAGSKIMYPGGSCGDFFDELLKKDGLSKDDFKRIGDVDRELSLGGDYRKLICKPTDV